MLTGRKKFRDGIGYIYLSCRLNNPPIHLVRLLERLMPCSMMVLSKSCETLTQWNRLQWMCRQDKA